MNPEIDVAVIVCSRVKNSRLPEKALKKIRGTASIRYLLERISRTQWPVVLAIPGSPDDDPIADVVHDMKGITIYRGQDDSPLERMATANATVTRAKNIVRVTGDDILVDWEMALQHFVYHVSSNADMTNNRHTLDSSAVEIYKAGAIEEMSARRIGKPGEMLGHYIVQDGYRIEGFNPPSELRVEDRRTFRMEVDYPEDLLKVRTVLGALGTQYPLTGEILSFLKDNEDVNRINEDRKWQKSE